LRRFLTSSKLKVQTPFYVPFSLSNGISQGQGGFVNANNINIDTTAPKTPLVPSFDGSDFEQDNEPLSFDDGPVPALAFPVMPYMGSSASGGMATPPRAVSPTPAQGAAAAAEQLDASIINGSLPITGAAAAVPVPVPNQKSVEEAAAAAAPESPITPTRSLRMSPRSPSDSRRSILLPEHMHAQQQLAQLQQNSSSSLNSSTKSILKGVGVAATTSQQGPHTDTKKTPLVVNRELYRAHRMMRLAVLEASKRFEEQQIMREFLNDVNNYNNNNIGVDVDSDAVDVGATSDEAQGNSRAQVAMERQVPSLVIATTKKAEEGTGVAAGLVMRHGAGGGGQRQDSTGAEAMRLLIVKKSKKREEERQEQLAAATHKAGRRNRRNKTVSDMSAMMQAVMNDNGGGGGDDESNNTNTDNRTSASPLSPTADAGSPNANATASNQMFMSARNINANMNNVNVDPWNNGSPSMAALQNTTKSPRDQFRDSAFRLPSQSQQPVVTMTIDENKSLSVSLNTNNNDATTVTSASDRSTASMGSPSNHSRNHNYIPCNLKKRKTTGSSLRSLDRDRLMLDDDE
jgi:hypothetical protein